MKPINRLPIWFLCLASALALAANETPLYRNAHAPLEDRVTDLLARLTLEEKTALCHGAFTSGGVSRLGIGSLEMLDGRPGLRPVRAQKGARQAREPGRRPWAAPQLSLDLLRGYLALAGIRR